jgi:hypothetical protein
MNLLKKILLTGLAAFYCFAPTTFAATSVLPQVTKGLDAIPQMKLEWTLAGLFQDGDALKATWTRPPKTILKLFCCALKIGEIQFWMVPYFVIFALEFVIDLSGLIVVLMILVGAYYYIAGGLTDDKEKGKTIITHAIGGFILVLSSWIIVNIILLALTS